MKLKKFEKAVRKAYEKMGITQLHSGYYRQSRFQGVEKIEQACITSAALIGLGYDVVELLNSGDGIFYTIRQEFNMGDIQIGELLHMNDAEELEWQEILERLK